MKQFIYLDSDIVNSIIAQREKGLVEDRKSEDEKGTTEVINNTMSSDTSAGIKGRLF